MNAIILPDWVAISIGLHFIVVGVVFVIREAYQFFIYKKVISQRDNEILALQQAVILAEEARDITLERIRMANEIRRDEG